MRLIGIIVLQETYKDSRKGMIAKVKKEIGKAKMKAEVELGRAANVRWILKNINI